MRSFLSQDRSHERRERLMDAFVGQWSRGEPSLEAFWTQHGVNESISVLAGLIKIDLRNRLDRGETIATASYLDRFPALTESSDRVVSLVYEEYCLREEKGEALDTQEFCAGYDAWRDSLLSQLAYHRQLSQVAGTPTRPTKYPMPGDRISRHTLCRLLGKGGTAQVYLATEDDLDDRQVVVKFTEADGREASILAHLRHPNIVSVISKIDASDIGLRGFSMLYSPGITLDKLVRGIREGHRPRSAREVWEQIGAPSDQEPRTGGNPSGWKDFPMEGTFYDAIAWIGLCVANALTHAHKEGILHRDVKPANILLAFDEGPKLFDFNLAKDPRAPEEAKAAHKGGTLPYMAPEQLHAFIDPRAWDDVGGPADLFSLGLVLREIVTGQLPELPNASLPLARAIQDLRDRRCEPQVPARKINAEIPPALNSILARCLEPSLSKRYPKAEDLAEDLRRFLDRRPLRYAPNTSLVERSSNLVRRNRTGLIVGAAAALILALTVISTRPVPFQETSAFINAMADLDAGRLEQAQTTFATFHKDHPSSAWASLYYGLTLERLEPTSSELNTLFTNLVRFPDAEAALLHRLKSDPNSSFLLTELGMTYVNKNNWQEARSRLEQACKSPNPQYQSFVTLSDVTMKLGDLEASASHLQRAIDMAKKSQIDDSNAMLQTWHQSSIARQSALITKIDRDPIGAEVLARLRALLNRVEGSIKVVVNVPWSIQQEQRMGGSKEFCINYYQGMVASGRASLASIEGKPSEMDRYLREASARFREAARRAPQNPRPLEQLRQLRIFLPLDLPMEREQARQLGVPPFITPTLAGRPLVC